jgi:hypothetical protein
MEHNTFYNVNVVARSGLARNAEHLDVERLEWWELTAHPPPLPAPQTIRAGVHRPSAARPDCRRRRRGLHGGRAGGGRRRRCRRRVGRRR